MATDAASDAGIAEDDDYRGSFHVYTPYRAGLPRMGPYVRELWRRREFMREKVRADIRSDNADTVLGRLWTVIGPLLSGLTYFLLVLILVRGGGRENYLTYLMSGMFLFSVLQTSMSGGARSVTSAGKMITNTAFPRVLLPLSIVRLALAKLWPMLIVLAIIALFQGIRPTWALLSLIPILIIYVILCCGIAMLFATLQVFFRDTKNFIPFISRLWLYVSPVLWYAEMVPQNLKFIEKVNPMYPITASWTEAIVDGRWPPAHAYITASVWAVVIFVVGAYFFISRERDFAVRI